MEFSDAIQDGIRGHHDPDDKELNSVAAIVHVANSIVHALDLNNDDRELILLSPNTLGMFYHYQKKHIWRSFMRQNCE